MAKLARAGWHVPWEQVDRWTIMIKAVEESMSDATRLAQRVERGFY